MALLKEERAAAETKLREMEGFESFRSVLVLLLEAERKTDFLRQDWHELEADHGITGDPLRDYGDHTLLTLSSRIPTPRVRAPEDGRRCEMCGEGFPAKEVITSPCGHHYHLFCLAIRVRLYPECCRAGCTLLFPHYWLLTFGFPLVMLLQTSTEDLEASLS